MLLSQLSRFIGAFGIDHGRMAAGHDNDLPYPVQLCSIQTVHENTSRS
jgi:hypothetical protein